PKAGEWVRLEVDARAVDLRPGAKVNGWAFTQFDGTVHWDTAGVRTYGPPDDRHLHSMLAWEARERASATSTVPADVLNVIRADRATRTPAQQQLVQSHYVRHVNAEARATFAPLETKLDELEKSIQKVDAEIPYTLISQDLVPGRKAWV